MPKNVPLKLEELKSKRQEYTKALKKHEKKATSGLDKLAVWITNKVSSMGFFVIIFAWTVLWLGWNIFSPEKLRFDPYPGFVLWLFISNLIQLFLLPLIMIGQNLQSQHTEIRADTDFKINELSEYENEAILIHLENQNEMILEILKSIENKNNKPDSK